MRSKILQLTFLFIFYLTSLVGQCPEQNRMYSFESLMEQERTRHERFILGGPGNSIIKEFTRIIPKSSELSCISSEFQALQNRKQVLDAKQIDLYNQAAGEFQISYQPYYNNFFVEYPKVIKNKNIDYVATYCKMDSLWKDLRQRIEDHNDKYRLKMDSLTTEVKALKAEARTILEFADEHSGELKEKYRALEEAYQQAAANGELAKRIELNYGQLSWNLENFAEYTARDPEKSLKQLLAECDVLIDELETGN